MLNTKSHLVGILAGCLVGLIAFPPPLIADRLLQASTQGVLGLSNAEGSLWRGSAFIKIMTPNAAILLAPDKIEWRVSISGVAINVQINKSTMSETLMNMDIDFLKRKVLIPLPNDQILASGIVIQNSPWLGEPWRSLEPSGEMKISAESPALSIEQTTAGVIFTGSVRVHINRLASRIGSHSTLGNYQLKISGSATPARGVVVEMTTVNGPLNIQGQGVFLGTDRPYFSGIATTDASASEEISSLLNIIGRREGSTSVIFIQ